MRDGAFEQVAPPLELYARPANVFVAGFVGSPAMNLLRAPVPGAIPAAAAIIGIRPQDIALDGAGPIEAVVDVVEPRGHDAVVHLRARIGDGAPLVAVVTGAWPQPGDEVRVALPADRLHAFDSTGRRC